MSRHMRILLVLLSYIPAAVCAIQPQNALQEHHSCHDRSERYGVVIESECMGGETHLLPVPASSHAKNPPQVIKYLAAPPPQRLPLTADTLPPASSTFDKDRDQDGVILPKDLCRKSKKGRTVDQTGCQPFYFYTLAKVYFDFDKAKLTENSKRILNQAIMNILGNPDIRRIVLRGNADWVGKERYNDDLSDERVNAVSNYLINHGVPKDWLMPQGLGENVPIDENWTRLGRVRNRHVELLVFELE